MEAEVVVSKTPVVVVVPMWALEPIQVKGCQMQRLLLLGPWKQVWEQQALEEVEAAIHIPTQIKMN
jgi:hypothetical protein